MKNYRCCECSKRFKTQDAANQHARDVHYSDTESEYSEYSDTESEYNFDPPDGCTDADGEWVKSAECTQTQSHGRFECIPCSRWWPSAYARSSYYQECNQCDAQYHPVVMWQNYRRRQRRASSTSTAPHDHRRCQACKEGLCAKRDLV